MSITVNTPRVALNTTTGATQYDDLRLTTVSAEVNENGEMVINTPAGYEGISKVNLDVDVQPVLEVGEVTPSTSSQTINPTEGKDGFSKIECAAVTSAIDANIAAGNIKNGVTILGVEGTYAPNLEEATYEVTSTAESITIHPSNGFDGMSQITITFNIQ